MKNGFIAAVLILASLGATAQHSVTKGTKKAISEKKTLEVKQNQIELGENMELKKTEFDVTVSNTGEKPINVKRVVTTAFLSPKENHGFALQPGESKVVKMVHQPANTGQFMETMVIESDASNTMEVIKVFGTIADKKASAK